MRIKKRSLKISRCGPWVKIWKKEKETFKNIIEFYQNLFPLFLKNLMQKFDKKQIKIQLPIGYDSQDQKQILGTISFGHEVYADIHIKDFSMNVSIKDSSGVQAQMMSDTLKLTFRKICLLSNLKLESYDYKYPVIRE